MDSLPTRKECYCPSPICLFYVNKVNKLVPIAIQLEKTPGPDNPIFLPSDNWFDWLLAKIYYRSADAQVRMCTTMHVFIPQLDIQCISRSRKSNNKQNKKCVTIEFVVNTSIV